MDSQIDVWTKWDEQTYGTNKHTMGRTNIWDEQTYGTNKHRHKKSRDAKIFFVCALILNQGFIKHPQGHGGSEYVLSFEIEPRETEGGIYSRQKDKRISIICRKL